MVGQVDDNAICYIFYSASMASVSLPSIDSFSECVVTPEKVAEFKSCVDTLHNVKVFIELTKTAVTKHLNNKLGLNLLEQQDAQVEKFNKFIRFCDDVLIKFS